jgi:transposase InsO family protein
MPAHMQHQMEQLLRPTKKTPFIDDLVIASKNTEDHKRDVLEVLQVLTDTGRLRLKMKKCKFFKTEARVLGFLVSRDGVRMDPKKVKAIAEWPRPVDGKAMQRFMGAANFNREFSSKFAELAAPLDAARTAKGLIDWTTEMENAFEALKSLFSSNMLLQRIDWNSTIYLTTDASLTGIGAWIGQKDDDGAVLPCICISKKLSPTQRRWSATKRELYALMWAMQKLRHYLIGRWFIARVDHRPLVNIVRNRMNLLLEGWMDVILQFNFTTEYLPGEENGLADALSRQHETVDTEIVHVRSAAVESLTTTDSEKSLAFEAAKRGKRVPHSQEECQALMEQTHALGHRSVEAMFRRLWNQGYWWSHMRSQLRDLVRSCLPCLRFDIKAVGYHPAHSVAADNVWDHVEMDLIGALPSSQEGYTYILTVADVLSGYVVLEGLKTKSMQDLARALWRIICTYGTMKILQTDNGSEFVNTLLHELTEVYGIDHRLITPYHPQANGLVERANKEIGRAVKKAMEGAMGAWETWLPTVQLGLNVQVNRRTATTPFALMFGRAFNEFWDFGTAHSVDDWTAFVDHRVSELTMLRETVMPAISERSKEQQERARNDLDHSHRVVPEFHIGDQVMAEDPLRSSKWHPVYTGPHPISQVHSGGAYTLLDALGEPMTPRRTVEMLRLVRSASSMDAPSGGEEEGKKTSNPGLTQKDLSSANSEDAGVDKKSYELKKILDQRVQKGRQEYLVHWKGYSEDEATWEPQKNFDGSKAINNFWRERRILNKKAAAAAQITQPKRSTRRAAAGQLNG